MKHKSPIMNLEEVKRKLSDSWPSDLVARKDAKKFSGGVLNAGTLANHDSLGTGPAQRINFAGRVAYTKNSLIEWMFRRVKKEGPS